MIINKNNLRDAVEAEKSILFAYWDMIRDYNGFGHNIETGGFNPIDFIDCEFQEEPGWTLGLDNDLLHIGSAVVILCELLNAWDDNDSWEVDWPIIQQAKKAFDSGRFQKHPEINEAFKYGFMSSVEDQNFYRKLDDIYKRHVIGYFEALLKER